MADDVGERVPWRLGPDPLRDHMTKACDPATCAYCAKHRRSDERVALLEAVAHRAWHLLDDGGEVPDDPGVIHAMRRDADALSDALDALEADRWEAHPVDGNRATNQPLSVKRPEPSVHRPDPGHDG